MTSGGVEKVPMLKGEAPVARGGGTWRSGGTGWVGLLRSKGPMVWRVSGVADGTLRRARWRMR